jgi:PAS domain-containing protein
MMREVRVAHVELSLSGGAIVPQARTPAEAEFVANLERWATTVTAAPEPCLIIDADSMILAVSPSCGKLFGLGKPAEAIGHPLLDRAVLRLIDFTAGGGELAQPEIEKIPPVLAIRSGRLARGLMRVQADPGSAAVTIDAIATPLTEADQVVASLTFFSAVKY